jgi:hypothetical protein
MAWAPNYVSTVELAAFLRISDTVDDAYLDLAIAAASRAIDRFCNRQFGAVTGAAEERFYTAEYDRRRCRWFVDVDDLMTDTDLVVEVNGVAVTTVTANPINAAVNDRPWTTLVFDTDSSVFPTGAEDEVSVTAFWGWTSVPATIKQATLLQASRFFARRNSPFGIAGSPDQGSELRLLSQVDPDVAVSLAAYRRWWAAV